MNFRLSFYFLILNLLNLRDSVFRLLPIRILSHLLINSKDYNTYLAVAEALGKKGSKAGINTLGKAYSSCEYHKKEHILEVLGKTKSERAAIIIEEIVRNAVLHSVDHFEGLKALSECGFSALPSCIRLLENPSYKVTPLGEKIGLYHIVCAIAKIDHPQATIVIIDLLWDYRVDVHERALHELCMAGDYFNLNKIRVDIAIDLLASIRDSKDKKQRVMAEYILSKLQKTDKSQLRQNG